MTTIQLRVVTWVLFSGAIALANPYIAIVFFMSGDPLGYDPALLPILTVISLVSSIFANLHDRGD